MRHLDRANLRYPNLWRGCVGAWAPGLGPGGSVLRDNQGRNHGALTNMNAATNWVVDQGKYAIDFDGTDDYVNVPIVAGSQLQPARVSCSAWVKLSSVVTNARVIDARDTTTSNAYILAFGTPGTTIRFLIGDGTYATAASSVALTVGVWSHICGTWDGATVKIYVNGVQTGSASKAAITYTSGQAVRLGGGPVAASSAFLNGRLDDLRVYDRGITEMEIRLLASRRGIAYEVARNRSYNAAAGFRPAWASQRTQMIGGGTR